MQKRFGLTAILFLILSFSSFAQNGSIKGFIYDNSNGEPMINTVIRLQGTKMGAVSDLNGYFTFAQLAPGSYTVMATALGYDTVLQEVSVAAEGVASVKLFISPKGKTLEDVEINAKQVDKTTKVGVGVTAITPTEINRLPSVGGEPDIAQFLQVLPGVVFTGDQGGQLYIRGGSPTQTGILLDGVTIYNPFHTIGLFSVFETDAIRSAEVISSGFGAQYGNRTSAIVDVRTKDGNKNALAGKFSLSPIMAHAMLEGPLMKPKTAGDASISFLLSAKHSYLESTSKTLYGGLNESIKSNGLPFGFTDLYGKVSFGLDNGSKLNIFGFNFDDNAKIINPRTLSTEAGLRWNAVGAGTTFILSPGSSSALINGKFAYSKYAIELDETTGGLNTTRQSSIAGFEAGLDFTYYLKNYSQLKYGFEVSGLNSTLDYANQFNASFDQQRNNTNASVFLSYRKNFGDKFIFDPSFRLQYYSSLATISPEPRLGMKYNVTPDIRLKAAAGIYSQNIISTKSDKDIVNFFTGFLLSPDQTIYNTEGQRLKTNLQRAYHVAGGIEVDIQEVEINIEPWYKLFTDYTELNRYKQSSTDPNFIAGNGDARGIDFSLKYNYKRLYLWSVFSYQKITFTTRDNRDSVQTYPPPFDRRFNMNLFGSYTAGKKRDWDFSIRYNLGSPFPFTLTQGFFENPDLGSSVNSNVTGTNGNIGVLYGEQINGGRLSWYHRVDISVKKQFTLSPKSKIDAIFSVSNVANRNNIFYVDRFTNTRVYQLPLFPSLSVAWNF
ncbi:MAG: carboxypeptidase-like regulatory domain-containing protein [Flavipsychrobacter sp.]|nr:carboxypeptidase-like regulatory domain-containing protein [Flavipsychrobacter sp.]